MARSIVRAHQKGCPAACRPIRSAHGEVSHRSRRTMACGDRLWVGIVDLFGVWWLIRRRRRVPRVSEVKRNAD
jgi:hypothetical protein